MLKTAIYPGSFDPITNGHIDLIERAAQIFDRVIVAVADNPQKKALFTIKERMEMIKEAIKTIGAGAGAIEVESFDGLVIDFAHKKKVNVLVRGLRMLSDFEYEFQMALTNRRLAGDIETIFLMPSEQYSFTSSTLLKEAAVLGADLSSFIPKFIEARLKERLKK